jgi:predicted small lipoprotein YifL
MRLRYHMLVALALAAVLTACGEGGPGRLNRAPARQWAPGQATMALPRMAAIW